MSDLKELSLEDLKVGMYVESSQLMNIRGTYIFIKTDKDSHLLKGEIILITKELNDYTDTLVGRSGVGVFYLPKGRTLGEFRVYE